MQYHGTSRRWTFKDLYAYMIYQEYLFKTNLLVKTLHIYSYNKDGNITQVNYAFRKNGIDGLKYEYDKEKRISEITTTGQIINDTLRIYEYDEFGRVSEIKDSYDFSGSGVINRKYTYNELGRMTGITYVDSNGEETKEAYSYTYDKNGNIVREESVTGYTGEDLVETIRDYEYDKNGRLTKASKSSGEEDTSSGEIEGEIDTEAETDNTTTIYSYDSVGNRTKVEKDGIATVYTFNSLNQLEKETTELGRNRRRRKRDRNKRVHV